MCDFERFWDFGRAFWYYRMDARPVYRGGVNVCFDVSHGDVGKKRADGRTWLVGEQTYVREGKTYRVSNYIAYLLYFSRRFILTFGTDDKRLLNNRHQPPSRTLLLPRAQIPAIRIPRNTPHRAFARGPTRPTHVIRYRMGFLEPCNRREEYQEHSCVLGCGNHERGNECKNSSGAWDVFAEWGADAGVAWCHV